MRLEYHPIHGEDVVMLDANSGGETVTSTRRETMRFRCGVDQGLYCKQAQHYYELAAQEYGTHTTRELTHGGGLHWSAQFLCHAPEGEEVMPESTLHRMTEPLGLVAPAHIDAFLSLYGLWLADGTLAIAGVNHVALPWYKGPPAIVFQMKTADVCQWFDGVLNILAHPAEIEVPNADPVMVPAVLPYGSAKDSRRAPG